jgi:hypothetical protein
MTSFAKQAFFDHVRSPEPDLFGKSTLIEAQPVPLFFISQFTRLHKPPPRVFIHTCVDLNRKIQKKMQSNASTKATIHSARGFITSLSRCSLFHFDQQGGVGEKRVMLSRI